MKIPEGKVRSQFYLSKRARRILSILATTSRKTCSATVELLILQEMARMAKIPIQELLYYHDQPSIKIVDHETAIKAKIA